MIPGASVRTLLTAAVLLSGTPVWPGQVPVQAPGQPAGQPSPGQPSTAPRTPPRAARLGEDPQRGSAVMRGYVIAADAGTPLRRALVRVTSSDGRSGGMTTTDADGRF
jgi:hypothetical protein